MEILLLEFTHIGCIFSSGTVAVRGLFFIRITDILWFQYMSVLLGRSSLLGDPWGPRVQPSGPVFETDLCQLEKGLMKARAFQKRR